VESRRRHFSREHYSAGGGSFTGRHVTKMPASDRLSETSTASIVQYDSGTAQRPCNIIIIIWFIFLWHGTAFMAHSQAAARHADGRGDLFGAKPTVTVDIQTEHRNFSQTRMWADAQRDGCPNEYRWRPLRKFHNSISCSTPQTLADGRCSGALQSHCQYRRTQDLGRKLKFAPGKIPSGARAPENVYIVY